MAKKENLEDYEIFYMELPQADYLEDIEIQDEYDSSDLDKVQGLSDAQVSEIARDSLDATKKTKQKQSQPDDTLFTDQG